MAAKTKSGGRLSATNAKGVLISLLGSAATLGVKKAMENPELLKQAGDQLAQLFKHRGSSAEDVRETLRVLREQVDYLETSADDVAETKRAQAWRKKLEHAEHAAQVVTAPGASAKQRRDLKKRIGSLRDQIIEAFLAERQEDLEDEKA